jgi:hypothetical protein
VPYSLDIEAHTHTQDLLHEEMDAMKDREKTNEELALVIRQVVRLRERESEG